MGGIVVREVVQNVHFSYLEVVSHLLLNVG